MSRDKEKEVTGPDLLADVLQLARKEGALTGKGLVAFVHALRERAALVIEERLEPLLARVQQLEEQVRGLEQDVAWRRETLAQLEQENAWRRDTVAMLEESRRALGQEGAWQRETLARLQQENAWHRDTVAHLQRDHEQSSALLTSTVAAHEGLLVHHRGVLARVVAELATVAQLPWWRRATARRRLSALADLLRSELP